MQDEDATCARDGWQSIVHAWAVSSPTGRFVDPRPRGGEIQHGFADDDPIVRVHAAELFTKHTSLPKVELPDAIVPLLAQLPPTMRTAGP